MRRKDVDRDPIAYAEPCPNCGGKTFIHTGDLGYAVVCDACLWSRHTAFSDGLDALGRAASTPAPASHGKDERP